MAMREAEAGCEPEERSESEAGEKPTAVAEAAKETASSRLRESSVREPRSGGDETKRNVMFGRR